jgi:uncharacterized lipoprotein YddW (UPF0748 family)
MDSDYNMYADVEKWCSQQGFCDYIVPQIYYGYENEVCPFTETAERWSKAKSSSNVSLVIGICTYKIGSEDQWAGNGIDEWKNTQGIPAAQAQEILENSIGDGIAVYSYESTFKEGLEQERSKLSAAIREYGGSVQ